MDFTDNHYHIEVYDDTKTWFRCDHNMIVKSRSPDRSGLIEKQQATIKGKNRSQTDSDLNVQLKTSIS